jgi:RND family efflux transporter MFP subunit
MKHFNLHSNNIFHITAVFVLFACLNLDEAIGQQSAAPVTTVAVQSARLASEIKLTGTVQTRRHSVLSAEVAGLVSELLVDEGDIVSVGDPLLRLRTQPAELQLSFEHAGRERAEAGVKLGQLKEQRLGQLLETQAAAQGSYDLVEAELSQAIADRSKAQASIALAEDELQRHLIRAPYSGVISSKQTELGSWVTPGDPLMELDELAVLRITAPLPQRLYNRVSKGSEVILEFVALQGQKIAAEVTRKVSVANPTSRTLPLLIDLKNPNDSLTPGMSVDVTVQLSGGDGEVLLVPADALVRQANGALLLWKVVGKKEQLSVVPIAVKTGRSQGGQVEILEGSVNEGDRVIEQGNERMRPDLPIRIIVEH